MGENEKTYLDWEGLLEYHGKLETKLSEKANTEDLADVATSGDYNDLENTPTNVSLFTNDAGYMTSEIDNTNGHDYVEIGGIKWATMNLGARNITDIGLYFQWGDILGYTSEEVGEEKNFTWEDYKFNPSGDGTTFSKYNSTDLKTSLDTEDDAAASVWGSDWRVPTTSELQTLSNVVNVSWTDDYEDSGVPGLILTDKEDSSKVLFLPATGICNDGSIVDDNTTGFYWSKSLGNTNDKGLGLGFDKTNGTTWEYSNSRSLGFAIRPVLEGPAKRTIMGVTQLEKDKWNNSYSKEEIDEELESMELVTSTSLNDLNTRIGNTNTNLQNLENSIKYDNVLGTTISSAERTAWNAKVDGTSVGSANGVASLDSNGKVPSSQLPSYVDDIIEGYLYEGSFYKESTHETEISGESGKIYVDLVTNKEYRWSGSQFVVVSETLALGETSSTAYRGDYGKIAYDHSQSVHARTDATKTEASETNGNIKINGEEITVYTHPGSGTNPHGTTKSDVGLGNVGNFKAVSTEASQGLSSEEQSNARANIGAGTSSFSGSYDDLTDKPTIPEQIQSDWNLSDTNAKDFIKNKPGIGVANGLATLDSSGKIPSSQLPSYVDDVIEGYYHNNKFYEHYTPASTGDDAAQAAWGEGWRMPTTAEFQALGSAVNAVWTSDYEDSGVAGLVCTDKTDSSKVLFFPAAGDALNDSVRGVGSMSNYWSNSLDSYNVSYAFLLYFDSGETSWDFEGDRYFGYPVRPILASGDSTRPYVEIDGVKWSTMNIGASTETDAGLYFQWGDTQGYTAAQVGIDKTFDWANYKYCDGTDSVMTKYNSTDELTTLELGTPESYTDEITAERSKIYIDLATNYSYRWSGSIYVLIGGGGGGSGSDEVQVGGTAPAISSDIKLYIDTGTDDAIEVYSKQQTDSMYITVIDSVSVPTESTLTYTRNGVTKNFKVGDEVRVADETSTTGYIFYKLYALNTENNATVAVWDLLGNFDSNETINISLSQFGGNDSDLIGSTITIINTDNGNTLFTTTWEGSTVTTTIKVTTNYTVSIEAITGYVSSANKSYTALFLNTRDISLKYIASGAYVEAIDGTLYTSSTWSGSGKTANSIVVLTDACKMRVSLTSVLKPIHSNYTDPLENYLSPKDETNGKIDYDGKLETEDLIRFNIAYGTNTNDYAAPYCKNYTFPAGLKGYLHSFGQLWILYLNKTAIEACLSACGGDAFYTGWNHCSTMNPLSGNSRVIWNVGWSNGSTVGGYLTNPNYIHVVADYEL